MRKILSSAGILPVITPFSYEQTHNTVKALTDGGITTVEIMLRTPNAINILSKIRQNFSNIVIGAGSITTTTQLEQCHAAGAEFMVTPGNTHSLLKKAQQLNLQLLPGIASSSDILRTIEYGLNTLKFFPANLIGGIEALTSFSAVFPNIQFCPTGGINMKNLKEFAQLKNVIAVGGSWLTPQELIEKKDWKGITKRAQEALCLLN